MRKRTLLIISLILVFAGCAGPTAVVTKSCIDVDAICREIDPKTGSVNIVFGEERKSGNPTDDLFKICDGDPVIQTRNVGRSKALRSLSAILTQTTVAEVMVVLFGLNRDKPVTEWRSV